MGGEQLHANTRHTPLTHEDVANRLPEYIAETLAGGSPATRYPLVAEHLASCADCRADYAELLDLARDTFADRDELPAAYPQPDLSALSQAPPPAEDAAGSQQSFWMLDDLGRWLVALTDELLALGRPSPLLGLARADDLLYDLLVPGNGLDAPELRVEVFGPPAEGELFLRFSLDLPALDAFDLAGIELSLAADDGRQWRAITNAVGTASIAGIPRPALAGLRIGVRAGRST